MSSHRQSEPCARCPSAVGLSSLSRADHSVSPEVSSLGPAGLELKPDAQVLRGSCSSVACSHLGGMSDNNFFFFSLKTREKIVVEQYWGTIA